MDSGCLLNVSISWAWLTTYVSCQRDHQTVRAGFLSPAIRGALLTALLVMYLLLAVAAGFASVWLWGIIHRSYDGW